MEVTAASPPQIASKTPLNVPPRSSIVLKCATIVIIDQEPQKTVVNARVSAMVAGNRPNFEFEPTVFELPPITNDAGKLALSPFTIIFSKRCDENGKLIRNTCSFNVKGVTGFPFSSEHRFSNNDVKPALKRDDPNQVLWGCRNGVTALTEINLANRNPALGMGRKRPSNER